MKGNISLIVHAKRKVSVLAGQEAARVSSNNVEWCAEAARRREKQQLRELQGGKWTSTTQRSTLVVLEGKGQGGLG